MEFVPKSGNATNDSVSFLEESKSREPGFSLRDLTGSFEAERETAWEIVVKDDGEEHDDVEEKDEVVEEKTFEKVELPSKLSTVMKQQANNLEGFIESLYRMVLNNEVLQEMFVSSRASLALAAPLMTIFVMMIYIFLLICKQVVVTVLMTACFCAPILFVYFFVKYKLTLDKIHAKIVRERKERSRASRQAARD